MVKLDDRAIVQWVFDNQNCPHDCPHLATWDEAQPYGEGVAYERLAECQLLECSTAGAITECPMLEETKKDFDEGDDDDLEVEEEEEDFDDDPLVDPDE